MRAVVPHLLSVIKKNLPRSFCTPELNGVLSACLFSSPLSLSIFSVLQLSLPYALLCSYRVSFFSQSLYTVGSGDFSY